MLLQKNFNALIVLRRNLLTKSKIVNLADRRGPKVTVCGTQDFF